MAAVAYACKRADTISAVVYAKAVVQYATTCMKIAHASFATLFVQITTGQVEFAPFAPRFAATPIRMAFAPIATTTAHTFT